MDAVAQPVSGWERKLQTAVLVIGRILLGYLFFTQLWWKVPPTFGCPADFAFTTANADGRLQRTSGLCDWIGIETVWSERERPLLVADLGSVGGPKLAIDIGFIAAPNGFFLENFVQPNIGWFGYVVWGMEAFIFISLVFGLFSRLGAAVAIAQSLQLTIGLAGISNPFEWEWGYNLMVMLSLIIFAFAPGRYFGLDALIRPRLLAAAGQGNRLAGALAWLT
jgi:uncharacterized membrane protein YphA (DoxX/SURF4 family)